MERTSATEDGRYEERCRRGIELMLQWAAEDAAAVIDLTADERDRVER